MPHPLHHLHKRRRIHQRHEKYPHPNKFKNFMDKFIYLISILTPMVVLPQAWKIWHLQTAAGISLITYTFLVIFNVIWLTYGILHKEKPIIILYASLFVINLTIAIGRITYG
jgi:uncharacterized protein with PQ loop repeat